MKNKNIIDLLNGNVTFLKNLSICEKEQLISNISNHIYKNKILNKILPIFLSNDNWYQLEYKIFSLIYLNKQFNYYTFYLLHKEYVKPTDLKIEEIIKMIENTSWGLDYILNNFELILTNLSARQANEILRIITNYLNDNEQLKLLLDRVKNFKNQELKDRIIQVLFQKCPSFNEEELLKFLYKNPDEANYQQEYLPFYEKEDVITNSHLPSFLLSYLKWHPEIEKFIIENFDILFKAENRSKMKILNYLKDKIPKTKVKKYEDLLSLYQKQPTNHMDNMLTNIINTNLLPDVVEFIHDKDISYLTSGTTTSVFKINEKVLKLSLKKYEMNTKTDLFLLAPTKTKIGYDENMNPKIIIEIQDYLNKTYNGEKMTKQDIENFFKELEQLGYIITDPNCIEHNIENFGFLKDYHDANILNSENYEDLPTWFKERPLVLYDIDLVYKIDENPKIRKFKKY